MQALTLQLPDMLHSELEGKARQEGISLVQYIIYALKQKIVPAYTIQVLPDADIQQQSKRFHALMAQLGLPDRDFAREFLANRELEEPQDQATASLIEKVEQRIASMTSG